MQSAQNGIYLQPYCRDFWDHPWADCGLIVLVSLTTVSCIETHWPLLTEWLLCMLWGPVTNTLTVGKLAPSAFCEPPFISWYKVFFSWSLVFCLLLFEKLWKDCLHYTRTKIWSLSTVERLIECNKVGFLLESRLNFTQSSSIILRRKCSELIWSIARKAKTV